MTTAKAPLFDKNPPGWMKAQISTVSVPFPVLFYWGGDGIGIAIAIGTFLKT